MIGVFFVKCQQSTKFKVKCYRCFINLKFSEFIRKKIDECSSASMSKSKRLNVFNTLVLFIIAPLLLYFFNHIWAFSVGLFGFSLKFLTSVSRVTVNHFKMGGQQFQRSFIVRVGYLYYYTNFLTEIFNFSIITIIERYVLLLHSWISSWHQSLCTPFWGSLPSFYMPEIELANHIITKQQRENGI